MPKRTDSAPPAKNGSEQSGQLVSDRLDTFIGIGCSHQHNVFPFVSKLLEDRRPDVITIEQRVNVHTSSHTMISMFQSRCFAAFNGLVHREGEAMAIGLCYAIQHSTPLYFVDGSFEEGWFTSDIKLATSLDMTRTKSEDKMPPGAIVYNDDIEVLDLNYERDDAGMPVGIVRLNQEEYANSVPERNVFAAHAINMIAAKTGVKSIAHIGGMHHFDVEMYKRNDNPPADVLERMVPIQDLVIASAKELYDAVKGQRVM